MTNLLTFDTEVRRSIVQNVSNGDSTHAPSGDAVYDFVMNIIGNIEEDMLS